MLYLILSLGNNSATCGQTSQEVLTFLASSLSGVYPQDKPNLFANKFIHLSQHVAQNAIASDNFKLELLARLRAKSPLNPRCLLPIILSPSSPVLSRLKISSLIIAFMRICA